MRIRAPDPARRAYRGTRERGPPGKGDRNECEPSNILRKERKQN